MQEETSIELDKVALFEVQSYKMNYKIKFSSSEIIQKIKFYFASHVGAKAFYQQYDEKFIPYSRDDEVFKYQPTFSIRSPVPYTAKTKKESENLQWIVKCTCGLNSENNYGGVCETSILPLQQTGEVGSNFHKIINIELNQLRNTKQPTFSFLNLLNSYFDIPNANKVALIKVSNKKMETERNEDIYQGKVSFKPTSPYSPSLKPLSPSPDSNNYQAVGLRRGKVFDDGAERQQIQWPFQRRYRPDYVRLLTPQTKNTLEKNLCQDDFLLNLPANPKIIELGSGAGFAVRDIKELRPDATVIAVGITPLFDENIEYCDQLYYTAIPDNLALLIDHFGSAVLVIDVFGGHTYPRSVRDAAIYAACLLKEGGTFKGIISGLDDAPHTPDSCPLGSGINRYELRQFFKKYLGIDMIIKKTTVDSALKTGKLVEDFYLEYTKTQKAKPLTYNDFQRLCKLADRILGTPYEIDLSSNSKYGKFKSQAIRSIAFFKPTPVVLGQHTDLDSQYGDSMNLINT